MPHMKHQYMIIQTHRPALQESIMMNQADSNTTNPCNTVQSSHAHIQNTCNKQYITLPEGKKD